MIILKLGGAAITDKNTENTCKPDIIEQVMSELGGEQLIIVHGAGSFGHIDAKHYKLRHGFHPDIEKEEQLYGISMVKQNLKQLNSVICKSAISHGLKPFTLSISSMLLSDGDADEQFQLDTFQKCLDLGMMPIFNGDVCFDKTTGFRVVSGDRIIKLLVHYLRSKGKKPRIIFGTDVDGLYTKNPTKNLDAKLLKSIDYHELDEMIEKAGQSAGIDVTGGMQGKLQQIKEITSLGCDVYFVNITQKGRLKRMLAGNETIMSFFSGMTSD